MSSPAPAKSDVALRVALFIFLAWTSWILLGWAMLPLTGIIVASALSTFGAGALANAIPARIFEHGRLNDFGLGWSRAAGREFLLGTGSGAAASAAVIVIPLGLRWAVWEKVPGGVDHPVAASIFVSIALLFGAAGEELLYRGYAFQLLVRAIGPFATILPVSVFFGLTHMVNQNANILGIFNTVLSGVVLGYAYLRSEALWLPIGIHFGWNLAMPLLGANLSGFVMGITGYALHWNVGPLISGAAYGPEGGVLTTLALAGLFWAVPRMTAPRS